MNTICDKNHIKLQILKSQKNKKYQKKEKITSYLVN